MPKIEVEESELAALQRVNKFAESALGNPKTRADMLRIQKTLNPDAVIPELDATDNVMKVVSGVEQKVDALMKKLDERDTKTEEDRRNHTLASKMQAGQEFLAKKGYNADGIKKVEDLMLAENIGSYAAGLALFEQMNPPAAPSDSSRTSRFGASFDDDFQKADDYKALWESQGQDENWLQQSLATVRKEFRN